MLARNRSELFSAALLAPVLTLGGVIPSLGPHTGTKSDGSWSGGNCADWTDEDAFAFGTVGAGDYMSSSWLEEELCPCCQDQRPIMCVQGIYYTSECFFHCRTFHLRLN
jgi:hypothetical protein